MRRTALAALVLFAAAASASAGDPIHNETYRVRAGDVIDVRIPGEKGGRKLVDVPKDGKVDLPQAGEVALLGRSLRDLEMLTAAILELKTREEKEGVRFRVDDYAAPRISFMGLVNGDMGLAKGRRMRLLEALAFAKILGRDEAKDAAVSIYRKPKRGARKAQGKGKPALRSVRLRTMLVDGDLSGNLEIHSGDLIIVAEGKRKAGAERTRKASVLMDAREDVPLPDDREVRLIEFLTTAGVLGSEDDAPARVTVQRKDAAGKTFEFKVELGDILDRRQNEKDLVLFDGDRVLLGEEKLGAALRFTGYVYVLGRVAKPGRVGLVEAEKGKKGLEPLTLAGLMKRVGGLAEHADGTHVKVIRSTEEGRETFVVDLAAEGAAVVLQPDDLVYVPQAR